MDDCEPVTKKLKTTSADDASAQGVYGDQSTRLQQEQVIVVEAPAGKLGVIIDTLDDGAPVVHAVKDKSVIANQIQVGDALIKVDDEDVISMTAIKLSRLISKKSSNPIRRLTIVRTSQQGGENP